MPDLPEVKIPEAPTVPRRSELGVVPAKKKKPVAVRPIPEFEPEAIARERFLEERPELRPPELPEFEVEDQVAIDELLGRIYEGYEPLTLTFIMEWAAEQPEAFLEDIQRKGRTEDTELLLELFGAEPEDIEEFFAPLPTPEPIKIPEGGYKFTQEVGGIQRLFTISEDYLVKLEDTLVGKYNPDTGLLESWGTQRVTVPVDGIRKLLTITPDNRAYDENNNFLGTYNSVTKEIDKVSTLDKASEVWDALIFGSRQMWELGENFFLSALPNLIFADLPARQRVAYGDEFSDRLDSIAESIRDKFRSAYAGNKAEYEQWLDKNIELQPRIDYAEGVTEHSELIKDPWYWGYEFANIAPFCGAVMVSALTAGALTGGNPLAMIAGGAAIVYPVETQGVMEALLANGASEQQAAEIAAPAGIIIASLESLGRLPLLKAASPHLMRLFRKEAADELGKLTARELLKNGIKTAGATELSEVITEVLQEAVQNAAVRIINENQSLIENLDVIAAKTAVATAPLSLFGGGLSMRRVAPSETQGFTDTELEAKGFIKEPESGAWFQPIKVTEEAITPIEAPAVPVIPEVMPEVKVLTEDVWNISPIEDRVSWARMAGLEGKLGARAWDDLTAEEQDAIRLAREEIVPPIPEVKPQVFMTREQWGTLSQQARSKALAEAGLDREISEKNWDALTALEREELTGEVFTEPDAPLMPEQRDGIDALAKEKLIMTEDGKAKPQLRNLMKGLVDKTKIEQLTQSEANTVIEALGLLEVKYGKPPKIPTTVGLITKEFADKIPRLKEIGIIEKVRPTRQVFEKMGLRKEIFEPAFRAEVAIYEELQAFRKEARNIEKLVGKDPERRRLVFQELENPDTVVGLTFNEKRAVAWFRKYFDDWADKLNLPAEKRRKNYVTHIFEAEIRQELDTKHPLDPELIKALDFITPKTIFNPFLQQRLGQTIGLKEDPFAAVSAYEARALKVYHYEPLIQKIRVYEKYLPPHSAKYLRNFITRITGRPLTIDRELNQTIGEFAEKISVLPGGKQLADYMTRGNFGGLASYQFTSGLYFLWLGFKPTSAIRNLSQHTLALAEVGPINFAEGIRLRFTEEGKSALEESLVLRSRRQAFIPGIDASFASQWTDKFRETALWMFRQADRQNVSDAFLSGYAEMKRNFPEAGREWWIKRGDEVAADTQYIYSQMGSAAWSQSAIGRFLSVLTTWPENWMELMARFVKARPSYVMNEYAQETGRAIPKKNWLMARQAMLLYMAIVAAGFVIKEETRLKAWEYTGLTSLRYLADLASGEFPALQYPGAVMDVIVGFLTDDERRLKTGWAALKPVNLMGIIRTIDNVVSGEKDWMTLFFYLEGLDWKIKQLKDRWEKDFADYPIFEDNEERLEYFRTHPKQAGWSDAKIRDQWREDNPKLEAKMFVTNELSTLSTDEARTEVLRLIEEHKLDPDLIDGYEKVFGVDTAVELDKLQNRVGNLEKLEVGVEAEYFTTNDFAYEVNRLEKLMGRYKIEKDGNQLAIEYLRAKDQWEAYYDLDNEGRKLYRQQFPELEAQLYLWGKVSAFENPNSAEILLNLMDKYDIPPEGIRAFIDNPAKYDELQTPLFELKRKWFDLTVEYEALTEDEERDAFKAEHPDWVRGTRRIEGIEKEIPELHLDSYVEYYDLPVEGYEQERFLKENEAYYNGVWLGILENQPKDFEKIPSVEFEKALAEYEALEKGNDRYEYRADNPEFDEEGVRLGRWKPIEERRIIPDNIQKLMDKYDALSTTGKDRLIFRHENPAYENWLVTEEGYTPVGDRWMEKAEEPKPKPAPKPKPTPEPEEEVTDLEESVKELEEKLEKLRG